MCSSNRKEGSTEERESSTAHSQTGKGKKRKRGEE